jgi:hypothetical protein
MVMPHQFRTDDDVNFPHLRLRNYNCVINIMQRHTPRKRCSYEECPLQAMSYGRCYNHSDRQRPDRQRCRIPGCNSIVQRQGQCRVYQTWGIIPTKQLPVICHPVAIPEARDGHPVDPLTAAIRPSTDTTSVNGATAGGQLRVICPPVAIPEKQDHRPADLSTTAIRPSTDATSVNGTSVGGQLPVICPPVANPEEQPANP